MKKEFDARHLDVKSLAEEADPITGQDSLGIYLRLMAETGGRGAQTPVTWSARGEVRNPGHLHPEIWLHLDARTVLSMTCQRCLGPVDMPVAVERSFRFVADESIAQAEDDLSEEDLLVLSPRFDLNELIEDELLMDMPVAPRHEVCPVPVKLAVADDDFEAGGRENAFAMLQQLKTGKPK
jgi:uncharacterized protein